MHDYKYYNLVSAENRQQLKEERERKNEILRMTNPKRKQTAWNSFNQKIALEGLSEEQLSMPY